MKEVKCLSVSLFKFPLGDCTLGGLSSIDSTSLLLECPTGPFDTSMLGGSMGDDYLVIKKGPTGLLRAIPKKLVDEGAWVMNGGNFVHTSDSRFPADYPIPVFDRVERK